MPSPQILDGGPLKAPPRTSRYAEWRDQTVVDILKGELLADRDRALLIDADFELTVGELHSQSERLAKWMAGRGVGVGDVVSYQLPNWWEVLVIDTAIAMIGAVANPILMIYRDAEVEFILRDACSKLIFIAESFRSARNLEMMMRLRPRVPGLLDVVLVRGAGELEYSAIVASQTGPFHAVSLSADAPRLLMYTSGTTGRAKGVIHSHNTLDSEINTAARIWGLGRGSIMLMPSPLAHITGYLYGMGFPTIVGMTTILMETWDATRAADLIERHSVNAMVAATPFLKELTDEAQVARRRLPSLRIFACGGAPVPPELVRRATAALENCNVFRVYGSTEAPTITLGAAVRGSDVAAETDGYVVGHDVKVVDEAGQPQGPEIEGEILTRGPELMIGYRRTEDDADAFDAEGYFRTGDLGILRADGALVITGRRKDLIIRGGENISAKELEDALYEHGAIAEVAIVSMPHDRLGEGVCCFAVLASGHSISLADMVAYLDRRGFARQKFPERLEIVAALPRTASGKVQKFVLRSQIADAIQRERLATGAIGTT
ncbi:acyl-CoA synthetase (AMP-forming)/AMP-acid ligase II [Aminobacter aminovorans]|uniref:Short-chain-fatty-acid--CoA ligase n=1 Tax=Aminobacter aminovorans TaxID=83263 RepID=A0A381IJI9_AMIAI|nr:AMP-binding protein [Aminobacter aminovorans]TCS25081.1 acyl-CoA synthetase (AMP-forming)/AMP-acid ligase II [Aminobacter aminovorans]SUY28406.1 Short-chain-fatty-acid--CoA ligase [Aminobacter aminovorans]